MICCCSRAWWFAGFIVVSAMLWPSAARAYTYEGPRTEISSCAGLLECKFYPDEFTSVSLTARLSLHSEMTLVVFEPVDPMARGGSVIRDVSFVLSRVAGNVVLNIRRTYYANQRFFVIDYPVTDPIAVDVDPRSDVSLDLTIYMSAYQAWIESRQGTTSLSPVWTVPMFFGFGPSDAGVFVQLGAAARDTRYFTVEGPILLEDINQNYASLKDYSPFLFQGRRDRAAGLLAAVDGGQ